MPRDLPLSTPAVHRSRSAAVRLTLALGASLALSACALGPTYVPPSPSAPAQWSAPLPHDGDKTQLAQWWTHWNDPALTALIDAAQANNATLEQAAARIEQARALLSAVGATAWPGASGSVNAQRGNSQNGLGSNSLFAAALQMAWELDLFGAHAHERAAARTRVSARTLDWHQARVALAAELASVYINLRVGEVMATAFERDATSRSETASLTELKTQAGFEAPANAALARASASEAHARLLAQRAELDLSLQALVALTGLSEPAVRSAVQPQRGTVPTPPALRIERVPTQVLAQRPDVASAERELAARSAEIGVAQADRYPRISLTGSIGYSGARTVGVNSDGPTWGFGTLLTLPIFDAGRRAAQIELAQANYAEALAAYKATVTRAVREVQDALTQLHSAQLRRPALIASLAGYEAFERAAQARLKAGAGSVLELEDARRTVLGAQVNVLALEREQRLAAIALYRAAGGGFDASLGATGAASTK